jgi:asparagine synthase (glutamine-hydrolysing)
MCGICGIFAHNDIDTLIRRMVRSLKHRGPDDSGTYVSKKDNISLGHTRLSIIDLSDAGHQPMSNEDETIWIVYNGETYNFPGLRAQLERKGHRFRSDTDTEVIIHLYEDYGEACVHKLNGMFAFAIWDESQGKLLLVRDRLGIKPLYYCCRNGQFAFSSEIKAILESGIPAYAGINWQAMYDYFSFLYVPHPQTIFEGIYQLPPACLLTFSPKDGKVNISKYWSIETIIAGKSKERVDYADSRIRLRELLTDSVNMRLISDVPLGVFLSGGIDSTILTGLMAKISNQRIMTFTVLFTGAGTEFFNEKEYADVVKSAFDTKHYEITIDISNPQELYDLIGCFDQPFGNPTFYLSYLISKYTREHVIVALSGAGGDELFAGYPRYRAVRYANLLNSIPGVFKGIGKLLDFIPDNFDKPTLHRLKLLFSGIDKDFARQYLKWTYYFDDNSKGLLFAADFQRLLHGVLPSRRLIADRISAEFASPCDSIQYVDVDSFLVDNILEYTDKTSMAVALEVRVPFLDHRIVEESFRMPYDFKLKNGTSKYILKHTFKDLIPPRILSGKKRGFCPPLALWMRKGLDDYFDSYLSRDYVKRQGFFNWDYIQFLRQQHKHGKRDNSMELFGIIMFDVWYRKYIA